MKLNTKYLLALITTLLLLNLSVAEAVRRPSGLAALAYIGPQGPKGPQGPQGPQGPAGSFSYSMTCGVSGTDACKIGSVGPGGGWIFFVDYNEQYSGFNYLEAAPTDIASWTKWCYEDTTSIYPTVLTQSQLWAVNGVGYGAANTDAMLLVCSSGAAHDVHAYSSNGKNDWFLGSSGEFMLMYTNLRQAGVGGFEYVYESPAEAPLYWTSTEGGSTSAVTQSFRTGQQGNSNKQLQRIVRPMRAF